jgi:hypothetical protein
MRYAANSGPYVEDDILNRNNNASLFKIFSINNINKPRKAGPT